MPSPGGGNDGGGGGSIGGTGTGTIVTTFGQGSSTTSLLTYCGIPLITPSPEIMAWVKANISTTQVFDFQKALWPTQNLVSIPFPGQTRIRPVTPHTLYWPTGASRFAVGYFFASSNQLTQIRGVQAAGGFKAYPLVMADGVRPILSTNLWMLPVKPLSSVTGSNNLWLLTLVDDRYWWWFNSTGALFVTANTTTWLNLYTSLGTQLGLTIQNDPINANYLKPASTLTANYEYLPLILDAIAYNVGQKIVRGLDGTVYAWNVGTNQAQLNQNLNLAPQYFRAGGILHQADAPAVLPATVSVSFPTDGGSGAPANNAPYIVSATLSALNIAGLGTTGAPFTKIFHGTNLATFTGSSQPSNQTTLQNLVNQIATDWYQYQVSSLDVKYSGIVPWIPEGMSDSIEWRYSASPKELSTRIQRPPWNDLALTFLQGEPPVAKAPGGVLGVQVFNTVGTFTYTPTAGAKTIRAIAIGGGAGGGGAAATGASTSAAAGGGGAGDSVEDFKAAPTSATVTVGAGGAGGTAGANNGSDGSQTTFADGGAWNLVAKGGHGGIGGIAATTVVATSGGTGGSGSSGGFSILIGNAGQIGISGSSNDSGGNGGSACGPYGGGGGAANFNVVGTSGSVYGGGGGGSSNGNNGSARAGGAGAHGAVIVWEFS